MGRSTSQHSLLLSLIPVLIGASALLPSDVAASQLNELVGAEPGTLSLISILGAGLVIGLRHAIEADHLAAISTIVSERRSLLGSSIVGGLWGVGHTLSLLLAGVLVIFLELRIPAQMALALEFGVALMLVGLGINALLRIRRGARIHVHVHRHGGREHVHPHFHTDAKEEDSGVHHGLRPGLRPLVIGIVHGLAGSAALMLLVLTTISSRPLAIAYIAVFGLGSIAGMMIMSSVMSLPAAIAAKRFEHANVAIRAVAAFFSLIFGLVMAWEIGYVEGLLR